MAASRLDVNPKCLFSRGSRRGWVAHDKNPPNGLTVFELGLNDIMRLPERAVFRRKFGNGVHSTEFSHRLLAIHTARVNDAALGHVRS
jgi:hypothetical protein